MSTLRNKDKILNKELEPEEKQALEESQAIDQEALELEKSAVVADINAKTAKANKDNADTKAQELENIAIESGLVDLAEADTLVVSGG